MTTRIGAGRGAIGAAAALAAMAVGGPRALAAPVCRAVGTAGETITLDGVMNEAAWQRAAWSTGFVSASMAQANAGVPRPAAVQTRFKVLLDRSAVIVGIECDEPNPDGLVATVTAHDGPVYSDDCVEIFLDTTGTGRIYRHFCINTRGAWHDDAGADFGLVQSRLWDCPLQVGIAVDRAARVWRAEVRVPLASIVSASGAAATWGWNITRERYAGGAPELTTWSPLKGNFHAPRLFGRLGGMPTDTRQFAVELGEPSVDVSAGPSGSNLVAVAVAVRSTGPKPRRLRVSAHPYGAAGPVAVAPAVRAGPGAEVRVALPPIALPSTGGTIPLQITVEDAADGAPCRIEVRHIPARYVPVQCDVLQPVYRDTIYATERVRDLVFRVRFARDIARRAHVVRCRLMDAAGRAVRSVRRALPSGAGVLRMDVARLGTGDYTLAVEAMAPAAAGAPDAPIAEQRTAIRKLAAAPGSEVRIDARRNIVVNGRPSVFIGWYGGFPLEDPRADVVALQNVITPTVVGGLDLSGPRRLWRDHRVYTIVDLEQDRLLDTFALWGRPDAALQGEHTREPTPGPQVRAYVERLVRAVRGEPWLLGYYIADEPEINRTRADYLESYYQLLRDLDPRHPVVVTNDTLDGMSTHGVRAADILNPDPYSLAADYVARFMARAREVGPRGKATMMTPWAASDQAHFDQVYGDGPPYPYRAMRHQYLAAVALGCRGFTGYVSPFFLAEPELRYGLPPIWREVRFLERAMCAPDPAPPLAISDRSGAAGWLRECGGRLYLVLANVRTGRRSVTVSHPLLRRVPWLDEVSAGRRIPVRGGRFTVQLAEGDARIYTTDPAGRLLPLRRQVAQDIRRREAQCDRPGNLLYWKRGVRAKASPGFYAPWFAQYFMYAINGITDDRGWQVSHTDRPAWLELALPAERRIGRVRVVTPNLEDYDLRFTARDGTVRVAEIRGNRAGVAEHAFRPPVSAVGLRITALRARGQQNPQGATVPEIEAYAEAGAGPTTPVRMEAGTAR